MFSLHSLPFLLPAQHKERNSRLVLHLLPVVNPPSFLGLPSDLSTSQFLYIHKAPTKEINVQEEEVGNSKDDFCSFPNNSRTGFIRISCF